MCVSRDLECYGSEQGHHISQDDIEIDQAPDDPQPLFYSLAVYKDAIPFAICLCANFSNVQTSLDEASHQPLIPIPNHKTFSSSQPKSC